MDNMDKIVADGLDKACKMVPEMAADRKAHEELATVLRQWSHDNKELIDESYHTPGVPFSLMIASMNVEMMGQDLKKVLQGVFMLGMYIGQTHGKVA
jgi:hypothetical protein